MNVPDLIYACHNSLGPHELCILCFFFHSSLPFLALRLSLPLLAPPSRSQSPSPFLLNILSPPSHPPCLTAGGGSGSGGLSVAGGSLTAAMGGSLAATTGGPLAATTGGL